jgi:hypothetical protein
VWFPVRQLGLWKRYPACTARENFDRAVALAGSGDNVAFQRFVTKTPGCVFLKAGLRVYIEDRPSMGVVRIHPEGETLTLYTNSEATSKLNETAAEVHSRRRLSVRTHDVTDP